MGGSSFEPAIKNASEERLCSQSDLFMIFSLMCVWA